MTSLSVREQPTVARLAAGIKASLERHFWRWASLFLLVFLASSIAIDLRTEMWLDELFTLFVAKQAGPAQIVKAIAEGCDGSPPLYAMIVQRILPLTKHEELAVRLPATLGYCGMILCLLAFCRRRLPAAYCFIAALLACDACLYYATEGRPYGIVLGGAAGALLCWQMAAGGVRRRLTIPLLALCLALMIAMHYYAIFFLVPLFLAELWRARTSGKLDLGILAAMAPAFLVLALHYPLIAASKPFQAHNWSPASLRAIEPFYDQHLLPFLGICSLALLVLAVFPRSAMSEVALPGCMGAHEWVALGALALMPAVVVAVSTYTTHVFVDRYVLWALMGLGLLAGALLCRAAGGQAAVGLTVVVVLLALIARQERVALRKPRDLRDHPEVADEMEKLPDGQEPIVVAAGHQFLELAYYAAPRFRNRLTYAASPELDIHYLGSDTNALLLLALSHRVPLHVESYEAMMSKYQRFLLAAARDDYLRVHLAASGYRVTPIKTTAKQPVIFEVEAPTK